MEGALLLPPILGDHVIALLMACVFPPAVTGKSRQRIAQPGKFFK
jgi:hypothetical protein